MRVAPGTVVGRKAAGTPARRVTGDYNPAFPAAPKARPDLELGTATVALTKVIHQDQMSVFSLVGEHVRNIHNDLDIARTAGLDKTLMQGQQQVCYLLELLTLFFGAKWFTSGMLRVKFVSPVYVDDVIEARGVVVGLEQTPDGDRLELEVWVRSGGGALSTVGWASALLSG